MTRGKYAARAAGVRVQRSEVVIDNLRARIVAEGAANAKEIGALKLRVERLSGQLTTAVADLAAERVARAEAAAAEQVQAERDEQRRQVLEMFAVLGRCLEQNPAKERTYSDDEISDMYFALIDVFGIEPGEAWQALAATTPWQITRDKRRETKATCNLVSRGLPKNVVRGPR